MPNIVNLRLFRKRRAREDAADAAEHARVRAGLAKTERSAAERLCAQAKLRLDGHLLEHLSLEPVRSDGGDPTKVVCSRSIGARTTGPADDAAAR
ncbi:hypothetical protein Msil_0598 [Methylocella silvestris BL2]|uniref:DUF4169 domain-containing protein n=1 Tax=Methylocella silvestris (strain DSM 15510 / CIP 108128 / LMG 27833 / NCIMB 13906 / BL2) TaxID=395965 RepID=B8ELI1_METSB|nr:DUF4169 family protein [Methylocella silvestris]ACK49570.1 hypothetical protein Msil_0598 [Methylocella silvestris BL2]